MAHIAPVIPSAKHGGRKRKVDVREVVNGIMYVLSTGCQWRYVPKDLPPKSVLVETRSDRQCRIERSDFGVRRCQAAIIFSFV